MVHSTNWSKANMATGVISFQLNGTPVALGVVNKLDKVIMILWGSPFASLTAKKPSAPAPAPLFTGIMDCFIRLFLVTMPWIIRAIWSAPPPGPAGITNSTGLVGSHFAWAWAVDVAAKPATSATLNTVDFNLKRMDAPPKIKWQSFLICLCVCFIKFILQQNTLIEIDRHQQTKIFT